jgi:DNA-binding transcriptional ArsR family regulator
MATALLEERDLDRALAALAHPARRTMLTRLALGPALPSELGERLTMSQPAVSKHLRVLESAGLITRGREGQRRPCRLRPEALGEVDRWVGELRQTWEARLDRLDAYLAETRSREGAGTSAGGAAATAQTGGPGRIGGTGTNTLDDEDNKEENRD